MHDSTCCKPDNRHHRRREVQHRRRSWCCPFTVPPQSPDYFTTIHSHPESKLSQKLEVASKSLNSFPNSPQTKFGLVGRIDPRRILSPGRVSPIDDSIHEIPPSDKCNVQLMESLCVAKLPSSCSMKSVGEEESDVTAVFDVRLSLKGKNGDSVVLEINSENLGANSSVFGDLIENYRRESSSLSSSGRGLCRIEVPEVENLNVFRETIELMFQEDITKRLMKIGVYRSIDILEVSAGINFTKGIFSCLKYLEAVPWNEEEEERLRSLITKFKFDEMTARGILARLHSLDAVDCPQTLTRKLVFSVASCNDATARNELKSLVKGILCKSSVYEKDYPDLTKEDIYDVCQSCLCQLTSLFEEGSDKVPSGNLLKVAADKSLIECISKQVDNLNWLLEILLEWQMAEEFIDMWTDQRELLRMHEHASPLFRYELSRVSAMLFIAMGTRKLHCRGEARLGLLQAWLGPMLLDFGWLQRCRKGLDMRVLEEAMGQVLLTLPLKQQHMLFMEWFRCFSKHSTECPNLSKPFQIWWRRTFLAGSESTAIAVGFR